MTDNPAAPAAAREDSEWTVAKYTQADMLRECFQALEVCGARSPTSSEPPHLAIERMGAELAAAREAIEEALGKDVLPGLFMLGARWSIEPSYSVAASSALACRQAIEAKLRAALGEAPEKGEGT